MSGVAIAFGGIVFGSVFTYAIQYLGKRQDHAEERRRFLTARRVDAYAEMITAAWSGYLAQAKGAEDLYWSAAAETGNAFALVQLSGTPEAIHLAERLAEMAVQESMTDDTRKMYLSARDAFREQARKDLGRTPLPSD